MKQVYRDLKEPYIDPKTTLNEKEAPIKEVPPVVKVSANYKSAEYKSKIDSLPFSRIQTKAIYKGIRRIFNNQKSEYSEGFYAIDLNNPKVKFYNGNGEADSVIRPKELLKYITENEKANIITIHNHRGDSYPSINDLYVNCSRNLNKIVVVGNKGSIYYCDLSKANYEIISFDFNKHKTYNEDEFKELCKKANVKFKIL